METISFDVQGSAQAPYTVTFQKTGNDITALCSCPAGDNGQACKHRLGILSGSTEGIVSGNEALASSVAGWLPGSNLEQALEAVAQAERAAEKAKKELSQAKKALGVAFRGHSFQ